MAAAEFTCALRAGRSVPARGPLAPLKRPGYPGATEETPLSPGRHACAPSWGVRRRFNATDLAGSRHRKQGGPRWCRSRRRIWHCFAGDC